MSASPTATSNDREQSTGRTRAVVAVLAVAIATCLVLFPSGIPTTASFSAAAGARRGLSSSTPPAVGLGPGNVMPGLGNAVRGAITAEEGDTPQAADGAHGRLQPLRPPPTSPHLDEDRSDGSSPPTTTDATSTTADSADGPRDNSMPSPSGEEGHGRPQKQVVQQQMMVTDGGGVSYSNLWTDRLPRAIPMETAAVSQIVGAFTTASEGDGTAWRAALRTAAKNSPRVSRTNVGKSANGGGTVVNQLVFPAVRDTCVGAIVSEGLACGPSPSRLSTDAAVQTWIEGTAGPHAFIVTVRPDGASHSISQGTTVLLDGTSVGGSRTCTYAHIFDVPATGGKHEISVMRVLSGFRSLDEIPSTVSSFHKHHVASETVTCSPAAVTTADGAASSTCPAAAVGGWWQSVMRSPRRPPALRWSLLSDSAVAAQKDQAKAGGLKYYPWAGKELRLTTGAAAVDCPSSSSFVLRPDHTAEQCGPKVSSSRPLRVLLTGDSHPRTIFRHFESVAYNRVVILAKGGNLSTAPESPHSLYSLHKNSAEPDRLTDFGTNVHTDFIWDPYLEELPNRLDLVMQYDVVAFGTGAWPASFGQYTYEQYARRLESVALMLEEMQRKTKAMLITGPLVVWLGGPAVPKPRKMPGYRITNARIGAFNTLGGARLQRAGAVWLDLFGMSHPLPKLHRGDGMHYDMSVVLYSVVDSLVTAGCHHLHRPADGGGEQQ